MKARLPLTTPFFVHRQSLLDCLTAVEEHVRGRVLDLGCDHKPYERFLGRRTEQWIGLDRSHFASRSTMADVVGDARALPFPSASFDSILCTQMIDDIPTPQVVFSDCFRVLKQDGRLVLSAAQYNALENDPYDYYRFTGYGLTHLAATAGFEVVRVLPVGGAAALVGKVLCSHVPFLNRSHAVARVLSAGAQWVFYRVDRMWFRPRDPMGWVIVCRKP